ncbi:hypothetical protein Pmani_002100 [Petrolisthes manimaculis]|uniref:Reverse transcriptase domain-containing protein n=1 Tax=Petrolisthes manimaculis TaxID=1843537 RepID=A0AAE1QIM3_9EUCA|nr:hypothetical protein Pmani_002100 [Petrolisthes manimaculis]
MIGIGDRQLRIREGGTHKAIDISQIVLSVVIVENGDTRQGYVMLHQIKKKHQLNEEIYQISDEMGMIALELEVKRLDGSYVKLAAMIDTGSSVSLVNEEYIVTENLENVPTEVNPVPVYAANQGYIENTGKVELTVKTGASLDRQEVVVVKEKKLPTPILLGRDYLAKNAIDIMIRQVDGENLVQVKINGVEVSLNPKSDKAVTLIEGNKIVPPGNIDENDDSDKYDPNQIVEGPNWKTSTIESVPVPPSSVGYVNLVTHVVDVEEARFEPSQGNKQARVLCPGIVKLHRCPDETKSIFTVMYVNVETEGVEIEEGKTMGEVIPCEAQNFMEDEGIEEDVNSQSTRENLYRVFDSKFPPESRENEILRNLIKQYPRVFATQDDPLKVTPYYMCTLRQVDDDAVWRKPYPIPVKYHEDIKKQIKQLRAQGTIRPSRSPYNTPLVPVPKKDGGIRLCLDFRALNTKLKDDKYPLPNIQVILQQLGESKIFSCLDMYQGYHQIPLAEESMEKTAFTSPEGHWEFTALPFGIKTAPACFQRIVNSVLTGLVGNSVFVHLDDVIIYGKNLQSHVENLRKVLERLQEAKLTLKLEKCEFFKTEVDYLGHVVSAEGLKPQPSKVDAVRQMAQPETVKELQSFLGLINYYRKFIYKFSEVASPLISLMKGKANKKNNNTPLDWTPEARIAFEDLKSKLAEEVTLAFPNFAKPFMLTTDASDKSIGGVLQQKDDEGRMRPLTFFSRTLNPAETRYSTIEKEALAVIYGLQRPSDAT